MKRTAIVIALGVAGLGCGSNECTGYVTQIDIRKADGTSYVTDGSSCGFMNSGQLLFNLTELHKDMEGFQMDVGSFPVAQTYDCREATVSALLTMLDGPRATIPTTTSGKSPARSTSSLTRSWAGAEWRRASSTGS